MRCRASGAVLGVVSGLVCAGWPADLIANSAPVVTNVTASQRQDGSKLVDIRYNLTDADGDTCTVTVLASSDNGASWTAAIRSVSLTGDVGPGVRPGTGKRIVWDCRADLLDAVGSQFKVRVCAEVPPGMVLIPAGSFQMGNSFLASEGYSNELPRHTVYLDAFYMDRTEVTNQQYADALNWAKGQGNLITVTSGVVYKYNSGTSYPYCNTVTSHSYSRITWNGSTFGVTSGKGNHPMVGVSWYGSVAYANWRSAMQGRTPCYDLSTWTCDFTKKGYRLPTEAEWEKAARGGADGRRFPWSDTDTIQHARANYSSNSSYSYDTSPTRGYHPMFNTGVGAYTSPAGYFAANGYALCDMAGNVWEWCNDWYDDSYYGTLAASQPNPRGPTSGGNRVLRGGSWGDDAGRCRVAYRYIFRPDLRLGNGGFRCVAGTDGLEGNECGDSSDFPIDNRPPAPVDFDQDMDVDQDDLVRFIACVSGPCITAVGELCQPADLDNDGDIDQEDFGVFQRCWSGENQPANPYCAAPPGMVLIPAGNFQMGNSFAANEGNSSELPPHTVYINAFYMDRTEVTNQQYADALNWAKGQGNLITVTSGVVYKYNSGTSYPYCTTTSASTDYPDYGQCSRITWNGSTFGVTSGKGNHPMAQVSWYGSVAYANWRSAMQGRTPCYDLSAWTCDFTKKGYRLPTEAEWEKAARGGADGRRFPWSDTDTIQHARANYYSLTHYSYDTSPTRGYHPMFNTGGCPYTSPAGYFAANGYGLCDMAGNVWEWCNDWYGSGYYGTLAASQPNPRGPTSGDSRVLRGGFWDLDAYWCRVAARYLSEPTYRNPNFGFRCVAGT